VDDFGDEITESSERYELRNECDLDVISLGSVIAIFSPSNSLELFYLCKFIQFGVAMKDLSDVNNLIIVKGSFYILVNYYEKKTGSEFSERKHIIYRVAKVPIYALLAQFMSSAAKKSFLGSDLHLLITEYQWLCDII